MSNKIMSTENFKKSYWAENSWIGNVYEEVSELTSRLGRLETFLANEEVKDEQHKTLLEKQHKTMKQYLDVLQKRIALVYKRYQEENKK